MRQPSYFLKLVHLLGALMISVAMVGSLPGVAAAQAQKSGNSTSSAQYRWEVLPPTPQLPKARKQGYAHFDGVKIWYAIYGHGRPLVMLHGGLANSNYFGHQVPVLDKHYKVIVIDSLDQGRSGTSPKPISYDLMAAGVISVLDHLHIQKTALVGWSDGAIIGLDLALHHPDRLTRVFAFAANTDPSGVDDKFINNSPVWSQYIARTKTEYEKLSPTPRGYNQLIKNIEHMWASQPHFTAQQLHGIRVPVWIVDGDHDGAIKRSNDDFMFHHIPGAEELILPGVSHFAFLQRPSEFNAAILRFMRRGADQG